MRCEPASSIVDKFGGLTAVASLVNVKVSTVQRWRMPKERGGTGGIIPHWHQTRLLEEAQRRGVTLEPVDFFRESVPADAQRRAG